MLRKPILLLLIAFTTVIVKAQTADDIRTNYLEFNMARTQGEFPKALELGEKLSAVSDKLPEKSRIKFYYSLATVYEYSNEVDKAIACYEKTAAAVPDFYVARRALGYLYMKKANQVASQLNAARTNIAENKRLAALYTATVRKALPHLEKAQACDPNDTTLNFIKLIYKNIKDEAGANSIDTRLKTMSKSCVDLLTDE